MKFFVLGFLACLIDSSRQASRTRAVHVLFRHGARTPDPSELYPLDPYKNMTFFPTGLGELTNRGKMQEFHVGKELRQIYEEFLGDTYYPSIVDAWSTDVHRTKASLQLALAGLFPPSLRQTWNRFLPWLPIPTKYLKLEFDKLLLINPKAETKPDFQKAWNDVIALPEIQRYLAKEKPLFEYVSKNSGYNITVPLGMFNIYFGFVTKEHIGLKVPKWAKPIYPERLSSVILMEYKIQTYTRAMMKLSLGHLVKKIVEDTNHSLDTYLSPTAKKINLYSAHEIQLAHMLKLLCGYNDHVPPYGSYIILEVYDDNGEPAIQFFYQNYTTPSPRRVCMNDCGCKCHFKKFIEVTSDLIPSGGFIKYLD